MPDRYKNTPINQIPLDVPVDIPSPTDYQFPSYDLMTSSIAPPLGVDPMAKRPFSGLPIGENLPMWMLPFAAMAGMGGRRTGNRSSEVSDLVRTHMHRRGAAQHTPVERKISPPKMPVTRENLLPMMDRYGLSLTRETNRPGRTQYYTFADRQQSLPLMRRDRGTGRLVNVPNPRYVVRIPDPNDVHPVAPRTVFDNQADRMSAQFGRFFDTAHAPGSVPDRRSGGEMLMPDRRLAFDRFGRTLGDIRNLEGELVNRHFPAWRRPAGVNPPRQSNDPRQLSFLRALLGE